jgi:hypothetical protein
MNSGLSLADHITLELRADYLDDSEHLLLQLLAPISHH